MKLAEELEKFVTDNRILYLKIEPELVDFTKPFNGKLMLYGEKKCLPIPLQRIQDIHNIYNQLRQHVFSSEQTLICWNIKSLISYLRFHLPRQAPIVIDAKVMDLKLIEAFLETKAAPPKTLGEAMRRLAPYLKSEECKSVHKYIHRPLSLRVLPHMETLTLVSDNILRKYVYPSYEIEGQVNGRLGCCKAFANCVNPHALTQEDKARLQLRHENEFFVGFDFKHMEVTLLQWLTGDEELGRIIESGEDVYRGIYRTIIGQACNTAEKRQLVKDVFLPMMYGMGISTLVEKIGISANAASTLFNVIRDRFATAWHWLDERQEQAKSTPIMRDHFGRRRTFDEKVWTVRNFLVQSPAAVVCLEKLIAFYDALGDVGSLLYSIHDGYVVVAKKDNLGKVVGIGRKVLEGSSKMCPGLNLRLACGIGVKMSHMKDVPIIKEKNANHS